MVGFTTTCDAAVHFHVCTCTYLLKSVEIFNLLNILQLIPMYRIELNTANQRGDFFSVGVIQLLRKYKYKREENSSYCFVYWFFIDIAIFVIREHSSLLEKRCV